MTHTSIRPNAISIQINGHARLQLVLSAVNFFLSEFKNFSKISAGALTPISTWMHSIHRRHSLAADMNLFLVLLRGIDMVFLVFQERFLTMFIQKKRGTGTPRIIVNKMAELIFRCFLQVISLKLKFTFFIQRSVAIDLLSSFLWNFLTSNFWTSFRF